MNKKRERIVWNIKDIMSSSRVQEMNLEQEGAYRRALDRFYLDGFLPSDTTELAKRIGNALVCIKAKDTLIKGKKNVDEYLNRDEVYYVQTPQIFKYKDLYKALIKAEKENFVGTDESMLVKRIGKKVNIVEGSVFNFKITTKEDVELFKKLKD